MLYVLLYIVIVFFFLIFLKGSNMNKTKETIFYENEEQMNFIADYQEKQTERVKRRNERFNQIKNSIRKSNRNLIEILIERSNK